jgi:hypothetical protein
MKVESFFGRCSGLRPDGDAGAAARPSSWSEKLPLSRSQNLRDAVIPIVRGLKVDAV